MRSIAQLASDAADKVTEQDGASGEQQGPHRGGVVARALVVDLVVGGEHGFLPGDGNGGMERQSAARNGTASSVSSSGWWSKLSRGRSRAMRRASSATARSGDRTRTATVQRAR